MIFEHPMTELMRISLKLERLFSMLTNYQDLVTPTNRQICIETINKITEIVDRPDLQKKLILEVTRLTSHFSNLEQSDKVDRKIISQLLNELNELHNALQSSNDKFAHELRNNEFLNTIAQYQSSPGGLSLFKTPAYALWLTQDETIQTNCLNTWIKSLSTLRASVQCLLRITRDYAIPTKLIAVHGFYQQSLPNQPNLQLLRIELSKKNKNIYPQLSASRHAFTLRFNELSLDKPSKSVNRDIEFKLSCCVTG